MGLFSSSATVDSQLEKLLEQVEDLSRKVAALKGEREAGREVVTLQEQIARLRRQITELEIQKDKREEDNARSIRETEHKVGLVRREFEAEKAQHLKEVEMAKRQAKLEVEEANLGREREAFDKEMKFRTDRFQEEVEKQSQLIKQILERLPNVNVMLEGGARAAAAED